MSDIDNPLIKEKLEAILDSAVDAIITIDERGIIESANPATEKLFGYSRSQLTGKNVKILMPTAYAQEHDQYLQNYLTSGKRKIIGIGREVTGKRRDGSEFPVHLAVSELHIGKKKMFTGVVRDISDVKRVEAKLVQNERLAAIGQMVAGLAHESRNAFQRSHACLANLALDVTDMPESLELVHKTQTALEDLNALLEEVRDYSARIILERSSHGVVQLIRDTWQDVSIAAPTASMIDFQINHTSQFPSSLMIDYRRMRQVFWNLLENARVACAKESTSGKIVVRLSLDSDAKEQEPIGVIEVTDSGPGIAQEYLPNVFEPFFTTKTKGTGLGLAISRRIIEAHGGSMSVTNATSGGASFKLSLPIKN